ncbi:MAG: hypothetical protein RL885_11280 [Planctomycetota bacterium]
MSKFSKALLSIVAAAGLLAGFASETFAGGRQPGSLLVYPVYLSDGSGMTCINVTNTWDAPTFNPNTNLDGVIDVHFIYIDGEYWTEFNRYERLTPNDTLGVLAGDHNPNSEFGFVYCVALDPVTQEPVDRDYLVGDELVMDSNNGAYYQINAWAFAAVAGDGNPTDVNANGHLDLDGSEYEQAPDKLILSSFIGDYAPAGFMPHLILVSLVCDSDYESTIDFEIFNNNEQEFSATYKFRCWALVRLADIDSVFTELFLRTTNHADELAAQTGWARIDGDRAIDVVGNQAAINDPALIGAHFTTEYFGHLLHETKDRNPTDGCLDALL